jgi:multidrug resistance efflux pump
VTVCGGVSEPPHGDGVRANTDWIAPQVSDPVVELPVVDNQHVQGDDLLLEGGPRRCQRALDKLEPSLRRPR